MLATFVTEVLRPIWGVLLMVVFLGIVLWAYWPKHKVRYDDAAMIPLRDEDDKER